MRILIIFLFSLLIFSNKSSFADLGSAEYESKSEDKNVTSFDAWCVEKYNDCLVEIKVGRLTVDKSAGITPSQLINWDREVRKEMVLPKAIIYIIIILNFETKKTKLKQPK